jgi:hypothetical protein
MRKGKDKKWFKIWSPIFELTVITGVLTILIYILLIKC